jgi:hypothetical protein
VISLGKYLEDDISSCEENLGMDSSNDYYTPVDLSNDYYTPKLGLVKEYNT